MHSLCCKKLRCCLVNTQRSEIVPPHCRILVISAAKCKLDVCSCEICSLPQSLKLFNGRRTSLGYSLKFVVVVAASAVHLPLPQSKYGTTEEKSTDAELNHAPMSLRI